MSAWLVSRTHVDALVWARQRAGLRTYGPLSRLDDADLGKLIWRENMLSLEARYGDAVDQEELDGYSHTLTSEVMALPVVALIKAVHCYQYQACEHDGWETSDAHAYCRTVENSLIHLLPGYAEAAWGIEDRR